MEGFGAQKADKKRGQGQSEDWVDTHTLRLLCFVVMLERVLFILSSWSLSVCLRCMHMRSCQGVCVEAGEQFSGVTFPFHLACIVVYTPGSLARERLPSVCLVPLFLLPVSPWESRNYRCVPIMKVPDTEVRSPCLDGKHLYLLKSSHLLCFLLLCLFV